MSDAPRLTAPFEAQFHPERQLEYTITRLLRQLHTAELVKVLAVYPTAGTVGFVDVQPLAQDRTTNGVLLAQAPIYKAPYLRLQAGSSAVILDPVVGDIGIALYAQRDMTTVISTRAEAAAATDRAYDSADALYLGGVLNSDPTQFVKFLPDGGIEIVSTADLSVQVAGDLDLTVAGALNVSITGTASISAAATTWSGPVTFNQPVTAPQATIGGIPFTTHKHFVSGTNANSGTPTT